MVCIPGVDHTTKDGQGFNMNEVLYAVLRNGCMLVLLGVIMLAIYVSWFGND